MQPQYVTAPKGLFSIVSVLLAIQMIQSMILQQMSSLIIFCTNFYDYREKSDVAVNNSLLT